MLLIHSCRLTASQEEYLANLWVHMSSGWGQCFLLLAAQTWTHTEPSNVTGEETVYGPTGDSNRGPLAYRARTLTTELKNHTHRRPVTISICLIRFIPNKNLLGSMLEPTRQSLCCPQPKHGHTLSHKMSKGRKKC